MTNFENNVQANAVGAIDRLESLAILMATGHEYDPPFVQECVAAAGMSMPEFAKQVEYEIRERVRSQFAAMGYDIAAEVNDEIEASDPDEFDESDEPQPYDLCGNVPRGATAVVYHDGRKLGEIKAPSGRFELQAAMPRGVQSVKVVAIDENGRSVGSDDCTFTVK